MIRKDFLDTERIVLSEDVSVSVIECNTNFLIQRKNVEREEGEMKGKAKI